MFKIGKTVLNVKNLTGDTQSVSVRISRDIYSGTLCISHLSVIKNVQKQKEDKK